MKVVPAGVQIGGVRVGGLTSEQARNAISLVVQPAAPLRLLRQALDRAALGLRCQRRRRPGRAAGPAGAAERAPRAARRRRVGRDQALRARARRAALGRAGRRDREPEGAAARGRARQARPRAEPREDGAADRGAARDRAAPAVRASGRAHGRAVRDGEQLRRGRRHLPRLERAAPLQGRQARGARSRSRPARRSTRRRSATGTWSTCSATRGGARRTRRGRRA